MRRNLLLALSPFLWVCGAFCLPYCGRVLRLTFTAGLRIWLWLLVSILQFEKTWRRASKTLHIYTSPRHQEELDTVVVIGGTESQLSDGWSLTCWKFMVKKSREGELVELITATFCIFNIRWELCTGTAWSLSLWYKFVVLLISPWASGFLLPRHPLPNLH